MIGKLAGAFLLVLGGGYLCVERNVQGRKEIRLLYELAAAMENIAGMIRWEKAALPAAIEQQCSRELCGVYFQKTLILLKGENTLQCAWRCAFSKLKVAEDILCRVEFSGDEQHLIGQLQLAAQQLRQRADMRNTGRSESEKLRVAVCASVIGLVTILLF